MNRSLQLSILLVGMAIFAVGCRPRAARSVRSTPQPTAGTQPSGVTAKSVLERADSALARIAAMDEPPPPVAEREDFTPRTPWGSPYLPKPNLSAYSTYEAALGAYNSKSYDEALSLFSQVIVSGQPAEMIPNTYYWMGEALYAEGRFAESLPYFEYVIRVGPAYKQTMAYYKLSRANIMLGNRQAANMWYERLRNEFPQSMYIAPLIKLGAR